MKWSNEYFLIQLGIRNKGVEALEPYQGSDKKIQFRCRKCNYQWSAKPNHILAGHGCPLCGGSMRLSNEQFTDRLRTINPYIKPLEPYKNAKTKILCKCTRCKSEVYVTPDKLLHEGYQCSECTKRYKTSFPEQSIFHYLSAFLSETAEVINRYREIDDISELDIYVPSSKTAIEYDGVYWHSLSKNDQESRKYAACKSHGIKLIRIVECPKNKTIQNDIPADIVIIRNGPFVFETLDLCIQELFLKLGFTIENGLVNTRRDAAQIQSQYFKEIEKASIGELYPSITKEWYQPENGSVTPNMVMPGSNTPYYWKCSSCGNVWFATPADRTLQNKGCRKCAIEKARRKYTKSNDSFIEELKRVNPNVLPLEKYSTTHDPILCKCLVCGFEWPVAPANLLRGRKCPKCSKKNAAKKISETKKGKTTAYNKGKSISVYQYTLDGNLVAQFESISAAAKAIDKSNGGSAQISAVCKGKRQSAYGFIWKYATCTIGYLHI